MKTDIYLAAIETTDNWNETVVAKTGRIFEVMLVDKNLHTHICSFSPSLWLEFVDAFTEKTLDDDTYNDVMQWADDGGDYHNVGVLTRNKTFKPADIDFEYEQGDSDDYDEKWTELVEYYRCNSADIELYEKCF